MVAHVLIVEFGGPAFQTTGLSWKLWLICIAFGVFELIWGQVIITISSKWIPKRCRYGKKALSKEELHQLEMSIHGGMGDAPYKASDTVATETAAAASANIDEPRQPRILWLRGVNRLQTQMRAVKAFQSALDPSMDMHSIRSRAGSAASRKDLMRQRLVKQQTVHDTNAALQQLVSNGLTPIGDTPATIQLEHRIEINHDS